MFTLLGMLSATHGNLEGQTTSVSVAPNPGAIGTEHVSDMTRAQLTMMSLTE